MTFKPLSEAFNRRLVEVTLGQNEKSIWFSGFSESDVDPDQVGISRWLDFAQRNDVARHAHIYVLRKVSRDPCFAARRFNLDGNAVQMFVYCKHIKAGDIASKWRRDQAQLA